MDGIDTYNKRQNGKTKEVCDKLRDLIDKGLDSKDSKVWHGHPVWFADGNPLAGYSVQKAGVRLMFWSGRSFDEPGLTGTSRFKDASIFYSSVDEINEEEIERWLEKAGKLQWDYKNIVKNKGELKPLKGVK